MRGRTVIAAVAALMLFQLGAVNASAAQSEDQGHRRAGPCGLSNGVKHVINVTFDNTHLFRDRPQYPSDLEQMPNLLNFMRGNGTLDDNEHTILISHTAGGILSGLTGLYPDRNGINVSNSYGYFKPDKTTASTGAFKYWTDPVDPTGIADTLPNMVTTGQKNTPAPWVAYTRAGCDFGAVATANVVLENTNTGAFGDITKVFGANSPQWTEAVASNSAPDGTPARALAQTDFVGLAVHCGSGGGICNSSANARPDVLPDEPGGYAGFKGLVGGKYVNPAITGGQPAVSDLNGKPITDPFGQPGFPGFDGMSAAVSLGYVAQMQESGVPVTFAYISDAHDNHKLSRASGPGEADYVAQLKEYDKAFGDFFQRLAAHGIDKRNTLFVFTADENDHFAGGNSTDGTWSHTYCNVSAGQVCPANQIGEVTQNVNAILPSGYTPPPYSIHFDSAPTFYVQGNPARTDPVLRQFERNLAAGKAVDPYVSTTPTRVALHMVDTVGEQALHMVNADPQRTPNFTLFANPDYFLTTFDSNCPDASHRASTCVDYHFAWSHGDATEDIGRTWLGLVGPGVRRRGQTSRVWSDHTDIRPTMLALVGLKDSYVHDGRVIQEFLTEEATPEALHDQSLRRLGAIYKQIDAPFAAFAANTLVSSTRAVASGSSSDDSRYASIENQIQAQTQQRDSLASRMRAILNKAAFGGGDSEVSEGTIEQLIRQGEALLDQSAKLAAPQ
ncbi:MAG: hypothetical protein DLM67_07200 [Candidatus Nephthysia bennettiae]|uniref:Alkaline phosphatase family protein n=1 Tax=Candidatus Nephthysia bennettiae TaxID=3127016 RepID=A0A934KAY1_9BACT|nr:hypothetical protein [Candidatus Dormibacteraeota bacterium]MBJ7614558.1 hypothetical protein [Candidatus Dormibacteraeota bacterium]PZR97674.1 MAG: hypothetical protein DLM67_07200 [Candidatus Dormibacteraeota bacterium]